MKVVLAQPNNHALEVPKTLVDGGPAGQRRYGSEYKIHDEHHIKCPFFQARWVELLRTNTRLYGRNKAWSWSSYPYKS